jgi:hypothetical protein
MIVLIHLKTMLIYRKNISMCVIYKTKYRPLRRFENYDRSLFLFQMEKSWKFIPRYCRPYQCRTVSCEMLGNFCDSYSSARWEPEPGECLDVRVRKNDHVPPNLNLVAMFCESVINFEKSLVIVRTILDVWTAENSADIGPWNGSRWWKTTIRVSYSCRKWVRIASNGWSITRCLW